MEHTQPVETTENNVGICVQNAKNLKHGLELVDETLTHAMMDNITHSTIRMSTNQTGDRCCDVSITRDKFTLAVGVEFKKPTYYPEAAPPFNGEFETFDVPTRSSDAYQKVVTIMEWLKQKIVDHYISLLPGLVDVDSNRIKNAIY